MTKGRVQITIDPYTHEKAKDVYDNFSARVEELVEADLDVRNIEDPNLIQEEIEELEEEKESLEQEMADLQERLNDVEAELNSARATLEKKRKEEEEKQDTLGRFKEVYQDKDRFTEDQKQFWKEETGLEWDELMEEVKA